MSDSASVPDLDPVVHAQLRLAALTLLSGVEEAEFTWLRDRTGSTDGNISVHLAKLEEAGYIAVDKRFEGRKPKSYYRMTPAGRAAYLRYLAALRALLGDRLTP
jgi:DNA-binding transcriptional ArsR family regulator